MRFTSILTITLAALLQTGMGGFSGQIASAQTPELSPEGSPELSTEQAAPVDEATQEVDPYSLYEQKQKSGEILEIDPVPPVFTKADSNKDQESLEALSSDAASVSSAQTPIVDAEDDAGSEANEEKSSEDTLNKEVSNAAASSDEASSSEVSSEDTSNEAASPAPSAAGKLPVQEALPATLPDADESLMDNRADIAPFYLSAAEYLEKRGSEALPQTRLTYEVVTTPRAKGAKPQMRKAVLALGTDFAALTSPNPAEDGGYSIRVFDFKFNRILDITEPETGPPIFTNSALYAAAHRNTRQVASATNDGKLASIAAGPKTEIDAFWVESAMSWAMNDRLADIDAGTIKDGVSVRYKSKPVTEIRYDEEAYPEPELSDALLAFAHHYWPIHPSILRQLYGAPAPIKFLTMISVSPQAPDGVVQTWTLKRRTHNPEPFPLPKSAINRVNTEAATPLHFIINSAARQIALGGSPTPEALAKTVTDAAKAQDFAGAWLAGQRYMTASNPCKSGDKRPVCDVLADVKEKSETNEALSTLLGGLEASKVPATRVQALKALSPWIKDPKAPAFILREIGLTRAKISASDAKAGGVSDILALPLISEALARDPYDPDTYLGLAQYYAASGDYRTAWDIYDALRSAISTQSEGKFGVERAESTLQDRAPGYFLPSVMVER